MRAKVFMREITAVLYLNGKGSAAAGGFSGGDFRFVDEASDEAAAPLLEGADFAPGQYELVFAAGEVFVEKRGVDEAGGESADADG